jgi:lysophospholipase L1-like esterase
MEHEGLGRVVTVRALPRLRMTGRRLAVIAGATAIVLAGAGFGLATALSGSGPAGDGWVASWGASPMAGTSADETTGGLSGQTVRNIIFTSVGGEAVRVRVSNTFGARPLTVAKASVGAVLAGAGLVQGGSEPLTFGGKARVTVPAGAEVLSDPLPARVRPLEQLAVSLYLPDAAGPATNHADAQQASYLAAGDHVSDTAGAAYTVTTPSWWFIDQLDVRSPTADGTIVAFGDSITDGYHSSIGDNARWPNYLARRLDARLGDRAPAVVNEGISGNRVLQGSSCYGVSAKARFQRDVLSQPGLKAVIVLEGTNDFGYAGSPEGSCFSPAPPVTAVQIEAGYQALITMAHDHGVKVYFATMVPPFANWPGAAQGGYIAIWQGVNAWIRSSGAADGMIDFARAVQDPRNSLRMNPAYDSGDGFHPNDHGYQVMADAIPLSLVR